MAAVALGVFGSMIGSFLNVVVYRVPAGRSVVSPPSACGSCGNQLRAVDNVPVLSWLALRGRCRTCGSVISVRYPLVELGTALLFTGVSFRFVPGVFDGAVVGTLPLISGVLVLAAFLYFAAISIALALIDLDTQTLPTRSCCRRTSSAQGCSAPPDCSTASRADSSAPASARSRSSAST